MDSKSDDSIQVFVRVRPGEETHSIFAFTQNQIHLDKNHFGFDHIFPPSSSQDDIFYSVGTKLITHTLDGYNGCVFVYGQTGSGKTYTMMGENNGLMQKSFNRIFRQIEAMENTECQITCSYYEIYNEQIIDLLDVKKDKDKKMVIRQDGKKGVFVENMTEEAVYSSEKLFQCLALGMKSRHVGETLMNRESSRSHSIFTINFSIRIESNGHKILKTPKLHFVDLAGSERQKMTAASGDRLKEAGSINKSLTSLGMVINALACDKARSHIPYRDSKLTSLLRDSLGGNSKTFLIATVSRNVLCFQQTLSTLHFANRAKMVKVKALINEQSLSTNIQTFKDEIRRLKAEILRLKNQKKSPSTPALIYIPQENVNNYDHQFKQINQKISVISENLAKNPGSPSMELLMQQIQNMKSQAFSKKSTMNKGENAMDEEENEMEEENAMEEDDDALIQYLSCNNSLLEKIHSKIDEYVELKQELRNMAYNNTMSIAELKTPSKFERDLYEQKLAAKQTELESLQSEISTLHALLSQKQQKIEELVLQATRSGGKMEERDEQIQNFIEEQTKMGRQVGQLKNLLRQTNEEVEKVNKKYLEAQNQSKQNKELYLYAEQNFETEKSLKKKVEENLLQKIEQLDRLTRIFNEKLCEQKQEYQQADERMRDEINILTQTVQFNEKLISSYRQQIDQEKSWNFQKEQKIKNLIKETESLRNQIACLYSHRQEDQIKYQNICIELQKQINQHGQSKKQLLQQIQQIQKRQQCLSEQTTIIIESKKLQNEALFKQKQTLSNGIELKIREIQEIERQNKAKMGEMSQDIQNAHNQTQQIQIQFASKLQKTQQKIMMLSMQNEQTKYQDAQKQGQIQELKKQIQSTQKQLNEKIETMTAECNEKLAQYNKIQIYNEELKKAHKDLLRDNYKLKAKYGSNSNKTEEQLVSKVNYYEEKFKLMSMEYQKALQAVKKMKEKQISQAQKIFSLQENQKVLRVSFQNHDDKDISEQLKKQNLQLKKQLQGLKSTKTASILKNSNGNGGEKQRNQLKAKEEEIFSKVQMLIKKLDPSKENISNSKNLEELLNKWEELQIQNDKKIDAISRGIKKEQKMKTQNKLIMKENIYLKEQLNQMMAESGSQPRKMVKKSIQPIDIQ